MAGGEQAVRIGVFAPAHSRQATLLLDRLEALRPGCGRFYRLDTRQAGAALLGAESLLFDGRRADDLDIALLHGFTYEDPVVPGAEETVDWSHWQYQYPAQQQRYSFLYSFFSRLAAGRTRVVNPPAVHLGAFIKASQLDDLRRAGLGVPDYLCTNDDAAVGAFMDRHEAVVWRTATGRCAWQSFTARQRRHLIDPQRPPVLLAGAVPGPLLRTYVVAGRPILTLSKDGPDYQALERLEAFRPCEPEVAPDALAQAADALGLWWGAIHYVPTPDGPVVYDVDVDPVLIDLPREIAAALTNALAHGLLGQLDDAAAAARGIGDEPRQRSPLFLRRMLRIQFDMEATKYADGR